MIFCVKVYVNKEMVNLSYFADMYSALSYANSCENKDYICEIECYHYHKTVSREFWREVKNDNKN